MDFEINVIRYGMLMKTTIQKGCEYFGGLRT